MLRISVLYPENDRQIMQVSGSELLIGREYFCDLRLADEYVSGKHCKIFSENGTYFIEDLKSTNGTFIDGMEIKQRTSLKAGQSIQIGVTVIKAEIV